MTTYLLPTIRTPGDSAHINSAGVPLCGQRVVVTTLESNHLCAYNVCPNCEKLSRAARVRELAEWKQAALFEI